MTRFLIRAIFDINCPWCYIGHTRLHRAIASQLQNHSNDNEKDTFTIDLVPYYLKPPPQLSDPSVPPFHVSTQSRKRLREETYGALGAEQVLKNIKAAAKADGLSLKFDGPTGTTRNGHRLIYHARQMQGEDAAEMMLDALFKAYHEREEDIASLEVLTRVGVEQGLGSEEDVREYLVSGRDGEDVDRTVREAQRTHRGGVPFWEVGIEGKAPVVRTSGAIEIGAWEKIFDSLRN